VYTDFFGLAEKPFSLTPNPRYVFHSDRYRCALEHLLYGLQEKEGFLLLTGMVGTGKTTLCRDLLASLDPERYRTALLFNPFLGGRDMLQALLTELGCEYAANASQKELLDLLNRFLLDQLVAGFTCVAIFDEAQHLSAESLEQIRVLSNLETASEKLIQIVLVGQPELRERIQQPSLAQLDQRVSIRCTLSDLNEEEAERYIYHRLNVAGAQGKITLARPAVRRLHQESRGVPRVLNLMCDRALLAAYVARSMRIELRHVEQGVRALRGEDAGAAKRRGWGWGRWAALALPVAVLVAAVGAAVVWYAGGMP
jgi:general secretion pathway protein A